MKILGIDTTRKCAKIYVQDGGICNTITMSDKIKHSEGLFLYIEKALFENKMNLDDVDYLCGVVGPGSFTGIRVGMSVIKGFAKSLDKKIISMNVFDIVADSVKNGVVLLNSTQSACYFGDIKGGKIIDSGIVNKCEIMDKFDKKLFVLDEEQNTIGLEYKDINIIENIDSLFFEALHKKLDSNDFGDFEPLYLQLSQAERNNNG